MKTLRLIILPAILVVAGLLFWLTIQRPPASRILVHVEKDNDTPAQPTGSRSISSYDYYFIPQNRSPEFVVTQKLESKDLSLPLHSPWGTKYERPAG